MPVGIPVWAGASIVDDGGRVLLAKSLESGAWDLPGGYLQAGEDPVSGVQRAVSAGVGAVVTVQWMRGIHSHIRYGLSLIFDARQVGGAIVAGDSIERVRWVDVEQARRLLWPSRASQLWSPESEKRPAQVVVTVPMRAAVPDLGQIAAR